MRVDILTLFPEVCAAYLNESILKRAQEFGALQVGLHNIRDYATDKHRVTDDMPFGGGGGMVLKPEPLFAAVESLRLWPRSNRKQPKYAWRLRLICYAF